MKLLSNVYLKHNSRKHPVISESSGVCSNCGTGYLTWSTLSVTAYTPYQEAKNFELAQEIQCKAKLISAHRFIVCALLGALSFQLVFSCQGHQHQCSLMPHMCLITDQWGDGCHSQATVATFRSPCSILSNNGSKRLSLVEAWSTAHMSEKIRFQS